MVSRPVIFQGALLKVASRCNLDCGYCYVYKHADQSWQHQPHFMNESVITQFATQLADYIMSHQLEYFSVCFHGGEPLLYSAERLAKSANIIRNMINSDCEIDFSIQTNGSLLDSQELSILEEANISISLSLDGPQHINDLYRLDHAGKSSYAQTLRALELLRGSSSNIFRGVISVINVNFPPQVIFDFFYPLNLPQLDLLLPDATHTNPPRERIVNPQVYTQWLREAFTLWFNYYSDMPVRWFDTFLKSRVGISSSTDAMGLGGVSLLVIETDGTYTDHDVFKITQPQMGHLKQSVFSTTFEEISKHNFIKEHDFRLSQDGVASECKTCPVLESCGGGSIMHRYHPTRRFDAPTVYCEEMFETLALATTLMRKAFDDVANVLPPTFVFSKESLLEDCQRWRSITEAKADSISAHHNIPRGTASAAAVILDEELLSPNNSNPNDMEGLVKWLGSIRVQSYDRRLLEPFSTTIQVLDRESEELKYGLSILNDVEQCLRVFNPAIVTAISTLISDLIFVKSTLEEEGGIFSFSDDKAPNILYLSPYAGGDPLAPDDIADSILHEFLHQVLHHIEQAGPLLYDRKYPRFPAPWRTGLRMSGGFIHGTFVFTGLAQYWQALAKSNLPLVDLPKAELNAYTFQQQAAYGISSLRDFALLTPRGIQLLKDLESSLEIEVDRIQAPGREV